MDTTTDSRALTDSLNALGWRLYAHAVRSADAGEVVLSPLSIGVALGMLEAGATGRVSDALHKLFGADWVVENRADAFAQLSRAVVTEPESHDDQVDVFDPYGSPAEPPTVRLANRMYHDVGLSPVEAYREALHDRFDADIEPLTMSEDPYGSVDRINEWVAGRTNNLIPNLLAASAISATTRLVLVNALYFKATWLHEFDPDNTEDEPFTLLDGSTVHVPIMHQWQVEAPATILDGFRAVELGYAESQLSMLVVLPDEGSYAEVEANLDNELVDRIDAALRSQPVELWLPRFTSNAHMDVGAAITDGLGIGGLVGVPDLEGIGSEVAVDSIQHAAKVIVDERSTEAAAATAIMTVTGAPPAPVKLMPFRADRPFFYVIRERTTRAVLFAGRVVAPQPN